MGTYTVKGGDTLWGLSRKFGIPLQELMRQLPRGTNPERMQIGLKLEGNNFPPEQERPSDRYAGLAREPMSSLDRYQNWDNGRSINQRFADPTGRPPANYPNYRYVDKRPPDFSMLQSPQQAEIPRGIPRGLMDIPAPREGPQMRGPRPGDMSEAQMRQRGQQFQQGLNEVGMGPIGMVAPMGPAREGVAAAGAMGRGMGNSLQGMYGQAKRFLDPDKEARDFANGMFSRGPGSPPSPYRSQMDSRGSQPLTQRQQEIRGQMDRERYGERGNTFNPEEEFLAQIPQGPGMTLGNLQNYYR
jgi:hypothetical protein